MSVYHKLYCPVLLVPCMITQGNLQFIDAILTGLIRSNDPVS